MRICSSFTLPGNLFVRIFVVIFTTSVFDIKTLLHVVHLSVELANGINDNHVKNKIHALIDNGTVLLDRRINVACTRYVP